MHGNDLVARLGGDEFLIFTTADSADAAVRELGQRLLATLSQPVRLGHHELSVTASMGVARFPKDGNDLGTLMRQADLAMYGAKDAGRNRLEFFSEAMLAKAQSRLGLEIELRRALAPPGEVVAPGRAEADFERPESLAAIVRAAAADVVVNAAGDTDVDRAEREPERAQRLNADAPAVLAREAASRGAWLVHYSSDYVFDGSGGEPWSEEASMAPLNAYGRSKRDGEIAVRTSGCRHLLVRTSWIHAPRRDNFVTKVLRLAHERKRLEVVDDQVGAPTGADLVADLTAHMLRTALRRPELAGTYHAAAAGATSRLECARLVVALSRRYPGWLLGAEAIDGIPSGCTPVAATRPLNSRLDTRRLQRAFELALPAWQAGVERTVAEALAPMGPTQ